MARQFERITERLREVVDELSKTEDLETRPLLADEITFLLECMAEVFDLEAHRATQS